MTYVNKAVPHPYYDAKKSWKESKKLCNLIRLKAEIAQKALKTVVEEIDGIHDLVQQLLAVLPKTDGTMPWASPLAPHIIMEGLFEYAFRVENKERHFSRRAKMLRMIDFSKQCDFTKVIEDGIGWALKLEKQEEKLDVQGLI